MSGLRIKGPRPSYRRGGRVFGPAGWTVIDARDLTDEEAFRILADPSLVIEVAGGGAGAEVWTPLSAEDRRQAVAAFAAEATAAGGGTGPTEAEAAEVMAELGRDFASTVADNEALLVDLDLWPVDSPQVLIRDLADKLFSATAKASQLQDAVDKLTAGTQTQTSVSEEPKGEGDAPAAPSLAGDDSQGSPPETAGKGDQGGGAEPTPPKPAPRGRKAAK